MTRMVMEYQYRETTKRLNVYGTDGAKDIQEVKKLIQEGKIPSELTTLFYQRSAHSKVGMMFRGPDLASLLAADTQEDGPKPKSFKTILKTINDVNTRQSTHAGLLIYSTNIKRFLFLLPRRGSMHGLLGDNLRENETAAEAVCRIAKDDCRIELTPECLVTLTPVEIDGTTYQYYLVLSNHEFKVSVSERYAGFKWRSYDAMDELSVHPSVTQLFEKDHKLQRLIAPIEVDFEKLIEDILHSE